MRTSQLNNLYKSQCESFRLFRHCPVDSLVTLLCAMHDCPDSDWARGLPFTSRHACVLCVFISFISRLDFEDAGPMPRRMCSGLPLRTSYPTSKSQLTADNHETSWPFFPRSFWFCPVTKCVCMSSLSYPVRGHPISVSSAVVCLLPHFCVFGSSLPTAQQWSSSVA